ncbi:hypothetical protein DSL72_008507 [Monilinia vaccinii-corymbosi]|uniref:Uncharacterized protein n=1 Tax=Monilinia vaccinii-corymbosi TaxID=61207 RepID=A0A8A3PJR8_9HELO|nr:hypothetical protein DSL72_008507 [Monilinia vaccinii-corymbosi]
MLSPPTLTHKGERHPLQRSTQLNVGVILNLQKYAGPRGQGVCRGLPLPGNISFSQRGERPRQFGHKRLFGSADTRAMVCGVLEQANKSFVAELTQDDPLRQFGHKRLFGSPDTRAMVCGDPEQANKSFVAELMQWAVGVDGLDLAIPDLMGERKGRPGEEVSSRARWTDDEKRSLRGFHPAFVHGA